MSVAPITSMSASLRQEMCRFNSISGDNKGGSSLVTFLIQLMADFCSALLLRYSEPKSFSLSSVISSRISPGFEVVITSETVN